MIKHTLTLSRSSVGESVRLIPERAGVQVPSRQQKEKWQSTAECTCPENMQGQPSGVRIPLSPQITNGKVVSGT